MITLTLFYLIQYYLQTNQFYANKSGNVEGEIVHTRPIIFIVNCEKHTYVLTYSMNSHIQKYYDLL